MMIDDGSARRTDKITAMYELCDDGKGKGSLESFDVHFNIEQMNKAFLELSKCMKTAGERECLFFSSERDFHAYYALLKLGSHPGHKVEHAELSVGPCELDCRSSA